MYILDNITQFQGQQFFDCLTAQDQGKGSILDLRNMIKLFEKIEKAGSGVPPHKGVNLPQEVVKLFTPEQQKTLTQELLDRRQEELWDSPYIEKLTLENSEFETLKKAMDSVSEGKLLPKEFRRAKRFDELYLKLESVKPFDAVAGNAGAEARAKKPK